MKLMTITPGHITWVFNYIIQRIHMHHVPYLLVVRTSFSVGSHLIILFYTNIHYLIIICMVLDLIMSSPIISVLDKNRILITLFDPDLEYNLNIHTIIVDHVNSVFNR